MKKKIYFFWEGGKMSFMRFSTLYSFRKFHSDWEIILIQSNNNYDINKWNSVEKQDFLYYDGLDYTNNCKELNIQICNFDDVYQKLLNPLELKYGQISPIHKKDILNWFLLASDNCIVSDMDILFVRNVDKEYNEFNNLNSEFGAICFSNFPKKDYIPVSIMFGNNSNYCMSLFNKCMENYNPNIYESCGYLLFDNEIISKINNQEYKQFYKIKDEFVFPLTTKMDWTNGINCQYNGDYSFLIDKTNTAGIHWYAGAAQSIHFNNNINHLNYNNNISTISKFLKEIYNA